MADAQLDAEWKPELPFDIFQHIVDHLVYPRPDIPSLLALSETCRELFEMAYRRLYESLDLHISTRNDWRWLFEYSSYFSVDPGQLAERLDERPEIADYVRRLSYHIHETEYDVGYSKSYIQQLRSIEELQIRFHHRSWSIPHLNEITGSMMFNQAENWNHESRQAVDLLYELASSPKLHTMTLAGAMHVPLDFLTKGINRNVVHLRLFEATFSPNVLDLEADDGDSRKPFQPRSIYVYSSDLTPLLLQPTLFDLSNIRDLRWVVHPNNDDKQLSNILRHTPNLENLLIAMYPNHAIGLTAVFQNFESEPPVFKDSLRSLSLIYFFFNPPPSQLHTGMVPPPRFSISTGFSQLGSLPLLETLRLYPWYPPHRHDDDPVDPTIPQATLQEMHDSFVQELESADQVIASTNQFPNLKKLTLFLGGLAVQHHNLRSRCFPNLEKREGVEIDVVAPFWQNKRSESFGECLLLESFDSSLDY